MHVFPFLRMHLYLTYNCSSPYEYKLWYLDWLDVFHHCNCKFGIVRHLLPRNTESRNHVSLLKIEITSENDTNLCTSRGCEVFIPTVILKQKKDTF